MAQETYEYQFDKATDIVEAEATLLVALIAIEALHGTSAVRMYGRHSFDPVKRTCRIDAGSELGQDLNRIYVGFLNREFGPQAFTVQRVGAEPAAA